MNSIRISRRTMLRGGFGVVVALPPLEIMSRPGRAGAQGAGIPRRAVTSYGGVSLGPDDAKGNMSAPKLTGAMYEDTEATMPFSKDPVMRAQMGLVSGLLIPTSGPGRRAAQFHGSTQVPLVSGFGTASVNQRPPGPSWDQALVPYLAPDSTTPHKSLVVRAQTDLYRGGSQIWGYLSFDNTGRPISPVIEPSQVWSLLFREFKAPAVAGTPMASGPDPLGMALSQRRKSILDLVIGGREALFARLGQEDKRRVGKYYDELRGIEQRISRLGGGPPPGATKSCARPADPGAIAKPTGDLAQLGLDGAGYNNEDIRAGLLADIAAMAIVCGLTRIVSYQITSVKTGMSSKFILPDIRPVDLHNVAHNQSPDLKGRDPRAQPYIAKIIGWHVKHFTRLAKALYEAPETDGSRVLDHTVMAQFFEGGFVPNSSEGSHESKNMMTFYGGGRALGIKGGQHIVAANKHPAAVLISLMNKVTGGKVSKLGEIQDTVPEMMA